MSRRIASTTFGAARNRIGIEPRPFDALRRCGSVASVETTGRLSVNPLARRWDRQGNRYQDGLSEQRLRQFLAPRYRDVAFVMTKTTASDCATASRHLDESLRRMKVEYLDLWQMHAVEDRVEFYKA